MSGTSKRGLKVSSVNCRGSVAERKSKEVKSESPSVLKRARDRMFLMTATVTTLLVITLSPYYVSVYFLSAGLSVNVVSIPGDFAVC